MVPVGYLSVVFIPFLDCIFVVSYLFQAVITSNGNYTPKFAYIEGLRAKAGV